MIRRLAASAAAFLCLGAAPAPAGPDFDLLKAEAPAPKLSDYRLPLDDAGRAAGSGLTPYALNTPLFSDYAEKYRFVALPPGTKAGYRPEGALDFPVGTVLVKTFAYPADLRRPNEKVRSLETRLLIRKPAGWTAQAYVWNADQSDAVLKRAGARIPLEVVDAGGKPLRIDYAVPNQNQCKECHQLDKAISPLGPKARNLNGDFAFASGRENQLAHWTRVGLLSGGPAPAKAPRTARWDDPTEPLAARARAYLDANCAHCHHPNAIASNSGLFLQWEQAEGPALGIGKRPVAAGRGSGGLEVAIAPGHPEASILVHRMASDEPGVMMPELGRSVTHHEGLALVRQWIAQMR
ncbi:SO2930 family diheme c-type cytochrome [Phenylobacterium sp. VNQ135]|uniref:SO2930 family diheme c-type cytochrome n=1 Tax=Phenylobacterium sp. VNQ135 TaxID=3400922 RepID=UPI003C0A169D